ncbi:hypothetical protein K1T73_14570 [Roseovarius sp. SCSIO 43702]|uniref:hypothetical protein n=1 Tax=Roseovarius sp. SCSIO 43702 TaxID=2823043 RepID=UPI001C7353A3|nr:hypothetical protein [Roseovarius sp. SCSIO 43702]QYX56266.1 hypothetical protein K1T73_14570 [Roseovarius sp. SCSIO 43702]
MIRKTLCLLALLAPGPALALSCMPHDVAQVFQRADEAEAVYIVVHGRLTFDESRLPEVDMSNQQATPPHTRIPARITGKSLGKDGFTRDFSAPVTLDAQCFGPWCAQPRSGVQYLAFLARDADGSYDLAADPCGGDLFGEPTAQQLETVKTCFTGGPCKPEFPR